jgi:hypothetical protein
VSRRVRASSDLDAVVDETVAVYKDVIEEFRNLPPTNPAEEARAAAEFLRWLTLTTRRRQAEYEAMLANSLTLRLRNRLDRYPLLGGAVGRLARLVRRSGV